MRFNLFPEVITFDTKYDGQRVDHEPKLFGTFLVDVKMGIQGQSRGRIVLRQDSSPPIENPPPIRVESFDSNAIVFRAMPIVAPMNNLKIEEPPSQDENNRTHEDRQLTRSAGAGLFVKVTRHGAPRTSIPRPWKGTRRRLRHRLRCRERREGSTETVRSEEEGVPPKRTKRFG
jgi:hypothetical protein